MSDQRNSNIHIRNIAWSMRRISNRDMDIYGCMCKNDHTDKNDNSKSCSGTDIYITTCQYHRILRSDTGTQCIKLFQWSKRILFNKWNSYIHTNSGTGSMWWNSNRDMDSNGCLRKNDHCNKNNNG